MRYLTRSYVEWLGLPEVPVLTRRNVAVGFVSPNATKPLSESPIVQAVQHDGHLYERESDGLAYARMDGAGA